MKAARGRISCHNFEREARDSTEIARQVTRAAAQSATGKSSPDAHARFLSFSSTKASARRNLARQARTMAGALLGRTERIVDDGLTIPRNVMVKEAIHPTDLKRFRGILWDKARPHRTSLFETFDEDGRLEDGRVPIYQ